MKTEDLIYLCTTIGNLSGIPVRLYHQDRLEYYHSLAALPVDPIGPDLEAVMAIGTSVGYHINSRFFYYGVVVSGARRIVIEAQTYARKLYENLGFRQTSDEFLEDGIPHIQMTLDL